MNALDPSTRGPSAADLKVLERLALRRQTLESVAPADEDEARVLARALTTLDDMEECLCEEGAHAPGLIRGWQLLAQLEARLAQLQAPAAGEHPTANHANVVPIRHPQHQGEPITVITAIETIRAVARRAAEDPSPGRAAALAGATPRISTGLLPRVATFVARLFAGNATGTAIRIVAQALAAFLPLLERDRQPDTPSAAPSAGPPAETPAEPELSTKDEARIDILLQEREARARNLRAGRSSAKGRARPDRPPESVAAATAGPEEEIWNDLLDLTSEALETFIRFRNAVGVGRCLDLLDLLAEAFGIDHPAAA